MADYEIFEHDVLDHRRWWCGLARSDRSLSGRCFGRTWFANRCWAKRTRSWPKAASPPRLANVDDRDNWKVHFADTMRGGQYVNNWRMAELHAKEAPDRVRELEAWGAVFDRTKDGRILQRNFGGHKYPRLAHVGDRTGLEMIRTLQDHGVHQGIDVHMEHTILSRCSRMASVWSALSATNASAGVSKYFSAKAVVLATGGIGRAYKITSNSWEYTGDGHSLAYEAGAELIDMEFVQFHPTGMVWPPSVMGILVTEGVAWRWRNSH